MGRTKPVGGEDKVFSPPSGERFKLKPSPPVIKPKPKPLSRIRACFTSIEQVVLARDDQDLQIVDRAEILELTSRGHLRPPPGGRGQEGTWVPRVLDRESTGHVQARTCADQVCGAAMAV